MNVPAPEAGPFRIDPPPAPVVGWIILTDHGDGTWLPDWDGHLHTNRITAGTVLMEARLRLGRRVRLAEVRGCA